MGIDRILAAKSPLSDEPGTIFLETERLILRRHVLSDAPAVAAAGNHPSIGETLRDRFPSPYPVEAAEAYMKSVTSRKGEYPGSVAVLIKPSQPGNPSPTEPLYIGALGTVAKDDVEYRTWEFGFWFTPSVWGKGFASEAIGGFVRWVFETFPKLNRLDAEPFVTNGASRRVLEKAGFVEEGRKRGSVEKGGKILDQYIMGLVRSDLSLE